MYLIVFFLFLASCCKHDCIDTTSLILVKQSKEICNEEQMNIYGIGTMKDTVTEISVAFQARRRVDICEARRLILKCVQELHTALNSNDQIQACLSPYPLPISGIQVAIFFITDNCEFVDYGYVSLGGGGVSAVVHIDNKLFYGSFNSQTKLLERFYQESYEEAMENVRNSGSGAVNTS